MSSIDRSELVVPAVLESIEQVSVYLESILEEAGLDMLEAARIQLAVEEAVTNVINHGYGGKDGEILITSDIESSQVIITITDTGQLFDPTQIPSPDISADLEHRNIGGLGVHLIRSVMDDVKYIREGEKNRLTMIKRFS